MPVTISDEQRQTIEEFGTPLDVVDPITHETYVLLPMEFAHEAGGYLARVPGIPAFGEGETEEEAGLALMAALSGYIDTFGD